MKKYASFRAATFPHICDNFAHIKVQSCDNHARSSWLGDPKMFCTFVVHRSLQKFSQSCLQYNLIIRTVLYQNGKFCLILNAFSSVLITFSFIEYNLIITKLEVTNAVDKARKRARNMYSQELETSYHKCYKFVSFIKKYVIINTIKLPALLFNKTHFRTGFKGT